MKVLFAVNNESISETIIKLYQKEYREIISGKNVYYFNAIVKELQRDQTYDRIVISEDLEPYTNNNFDIIDKFLFEQLDKISDEAISGSGADIPIIFIAADRRSKSDNLLSKLFSIGIYDALLGPDRTIPEVCKLLNKSRTKKEAKSYYKIETDDVAYHAETEDSVSETEIQNILTHYKKLGKNTERYVDSFNNIAAQYNDAQLRVISKFLPIGVKAVLEAESPKYQSVMTFGEGTYKKAAAKEEKKNDLKIGFIETNSDKDKPTKPVVIPSTVSKDNVKKLTKKQEDKKEEIKPVEEVKQNVQLDIEDDAFSNLFEEPELENKAPVEEVKAEIEEVKKETETTDPVEEAVPVQPRRRGRPRKTPIEPEVPKVPKKRGRPRKNPLPEEAQVESKPKKEDNVLPGFDEIEENTLPGFDEIEENILPGFDEVNNEEEIDSSLYNLGGQAEDFPEEKQIENTNQTVNNANLARLLSRDKKVVAFVGTSKCGTSFLINNVADLIAKSGINTAILDVTSNKNSYYIYTKNEEPLRRKTINCLESLEQNIVDGINVSKNLTVFTSIPGKRVEVNDIEAVVSSLVKQYSLVLIDCDFKTPAEYFKLAQEIYLVQSMDILTIQPLTAFLRDLQSSNNLDTSKLKVIINKAMKVRGLNANAIIGGMSCYNDPEMSYMRNLFDKDKIPSIIISFDGEVLAKYLSGMVDCIVTVNGYSKQFMSELKKLADTIYPLISNKHRQDITKNNKFSVADEEEQKASFTSNISNTLDRMKKQFK